MARLCIIIFAVLFFLLFACGGKKSALKDQKQTTTETSATIADTATKTPAVDPEAMPMPAEIGWVIKESINVRSQPNTQSEIVTRLRRGDQVKLLENANQWWSVELADGRVAFIHESQLSKDRWVDPWTQFRLGSQLSDTSLQVIVGVVEMKDSVGTSAILTVADLWQSHSRDDQASIAKSAFTFWQTCLTKSGYDPKVATIYIRDKAGTQLVTVTNIGSADGKPRIVFEQ